MEENKEEKEERPLTEEEKKLFEKADKKLDRVVDDNRSNIQIKKKIFMKISDVDVEDAAWFKRFCDEHAAGKQFLGIKVLKAVMERMDPLLKNVLDQINQLNARVEAIETMFQNPPEEGIKLPRAQGSRRGK